MNLLRRVLYVAWQDPASRRIFPVARLLDRAAAGGVRWEFVYIRGAHDARESGFAPFVGLQELDAVYESEELPPFFSNRLMPYRRPDFPEYLRHLALPADERQEVPILARSEGRRATDTIELFGLPSFDETAQCFRFYFFVRGVRHVAGAEQRIAAMATDAELDFAPDPNNPADELAVQVHGPARGQIGWVPHTLLDDVHALQQRGASVRLRVAQVNPDPAPVQLRVLCRMEAFGAGDYAPFCSERYQPIASGAAVIDVCQQSLVA